MNKQNVLIIGSGGREHAFAYKIKNSPLLKNLYIAPGNPGTESLGVNLALNDVTNFEEIKALVISHKINIVIVGPEVPLVKGLNDFFKKEKELKSVAFFGPTKAAAKLEGSKIFSKNFMQKYQIPTANFEHFSEHQYEEAILFLNTIPGPYVLKADGLAEGKGVVITYQREKAQKVVKEMMIEKKFGSASKDIVIESFLSGIELSVFVLSDGKDYKILPCAKDYKRISDGDIGLNTGGMGAVSPPPFVSDTFIKQIEEKIIRPTFTGLRKEGINYQGILFIGIMKIEKEPFVIEYNIRMGDPEAEVVFPKIDSDLLALIYSTTNGTLKDNPLEINSNIFATVVLASGGYPEKYTKNLPISISKDNSCKSIIFHAGTKKEKETLLTNGGRVLAITSSGSTVKEAVKKSYKTIENIKFSNQYFRKDIGQDLIKL